MVGKLYFNFLDDLSVVFVLYILEVIDSSVILKLVKEEIEYMKLDDIYNVYMVYFKGDEKYFK